MAVDEIELSDLKRNKSASKKKKRVIKKKPKSDIKDESTKSKTGSEKKKKKIKLKKKKASQKSDKPAKAKIAKGESLALIDNFEEERRRIEENIPSVMESELQHVREYSEMFNTLSRMVRIAEEKYLKSEQSRDMYAALKGYAEMREIIADMKAMADFSQYSQMIITDIANPLAQSSAAALIEYHKSVIGFLKTVLDTNQERLVLDRLKSYATEAGSKIKESLDSASKAADSMFSPGNK